MTAGSLQLYSFFMSSSAHSVRIALNLKGLDYEYKSINLFRNEQQRPEYLKINPIGYVPALKDGDLVLADSFAIAMYLEEKYPQCPLLPRDLKKKALNYQVINVITSSIQPLVRIPITGYIKRNLGHDEMISWAHKHYEKGLAALEILLKDHAGKYATGDEIFMADIFLEPIITLSQRYEVDMSKYPLLSRLSKEYKQADVFLEPIITPSQFYRFDMTINGHESLKKLQLYSSFISPPSFSVRIALNLKGIDYEYKSVYLFKGEQFLPEFLKINPMGYVPAIVDGDIVLADSSAIMWYLDEKYPQYPLLPADFKKKAINYQAAHVVSSSLQPILRIPILMYIEKNVGLDQKISWIHKHLEKCFTALEKLLKDHAGKYATGDEFFLADVFLAPYVIGYPERYNFDMTGFPLLSRLGEEYVKVEAIQNAMPEKQPDFSKM